MLLASWCRSRARSWGGWQRKLSGGLTRKERASRADCRRRVAAGGGTEEAAGGPDEQVAAFRAAWMRHVALEEQVTAATAEVGRAMQSFKMLARSGDAKGEAVKAYLRGGGGRETVEDAGPELGGLTGGPA